MGLIADISHYQRVTDWAAAAKELDLCILRASVGMNRDREYAANAAGCRANGIPYHAYHYLKAVDVSAARAEAENFAAAVGDTEPLFYVIDCECDDVEAVEAIRKGAATQIVKAFMDRLRMIIGRDIRIAAYIGHNSYPKWALDLDLLKFEYVWIPRYGSNSGVPEEGKEPKYACDLWQYTSNGRIDGIPGRVDLNMCVSGKPLEFYTTRKESEEERAMLTNEQFSDFCLQVYDRRWVYWYGTYGNACTKSKYESKKKQYPKHYTSDRTSGYMADIAAGRVCSDCVGLLKAFAWKGGNIDATAVYGANGCPDKSADSMFKLCVEKGPISTMPNVRGLVLHKAGHFGVHVGNGVTVEMKSFASDCVKSTVGKGSWTEWGRLPETILHYLPADGEQNGAPDAHYALGDRVLRNGDKGDDVIELQKLLISMGYSLRRYGADGDFGGETETALKLFQHDYSLEETGIADGATLDVLKDCLSHPEDTEILPEPDRPEEPAEPKRFLLLIEGDEETLRELQAVKGGMLAEVDSVSVL